MAVVNIKGLGGAKPLHFEPIPAGKYRVQVSIPEMTTTRNKGMPMLKLKLRVDGGDHDNRALFTQIVLPNEQNSEKANEMGMGKVAALLVACGIPLGDSWDTADLQGKFFTAVVHRKTNSETGQDQNEVADFLPA